MHCLTFLLFNAVGGYGVTVLGYFLGQVAFVRDHIELIVAASIVPIAIELRRARSGPRTAAGKACD